MNMLIAAAVLSLFGGADPAGSAQDKRARITELLQQAEQENKKGNAEAAKRALAEAWALTADVYAEQGNMSAANEAWRTAVSNGWKGKSPVDKAEAARRPEEKTPAPTPPPRARQDDPLRVQDEQPTFERTPSGTRSSGRSVPLAEPWGRVALSPYEGSRANGWHGLLNTPPLEAAWTLPRSKWDVCARVDLSTIDFADDGGGGPSVWHTTTVTETLEVDYGFTDRLQVGLRGSVGQVGEGDDERIRIFEDGRQIVPTDTRSFGIESLVLRGKYAAPVSFGDLGVLAEFKIPLSSEEDMLTSQTMDFGLSALFSKRWDRVALHLNGGLVFPVGDPELFTENDDVDPYFHGGVTIVGAVHETFSLLAQLEFNTSAFGDVGVLDAPVLTLHFGARYKVTPTTFLGGALGFGLNDESGDLFLATSIDMLF